ncbi:MAG: hypothetical protein IPG32_05690 [Saprospirales bacterium]|nr:hypothetical protein [Saprospirales bacterium]
MNTVIKPTIACQQVDSYRLDPSFIHSYAPNVGDVGLFEVLSPGKHRLIQNPQGANTYIYEGDHILAVFGNRYATKVFEGVVPVEPQTVYQMLGRGGVIGSVRTAHSKIEEPTLLRQIAYAVDDKGQVLNTLYLRNQGSRFDPNRTFPGQVILSVGTTMDSGKTTSAAYLAGGLKRAGFRVAYIKLTGTLFLKDTPFVLDRGADMAIDFSMFGYPSTYCCELDELLDLHQSLLDATAPARPDYILIEIADGLLQRETHMLLSDPGFMRTVDEVLFSCSDSLGALGGLQVLAKLGITPFALSGLLTVSPLLVEETRAFVREPIFTIEELLEGPAVQLLLQRQQSRSMELRRA